LFWRALLLRRADLQRLAADSGLERPEPASRVRSRVCWLGGPFQAGL